MITLAETEVSENQEIIQRTSKKDRYSENDIRKGNVYLCFIDNAKVQHKEMFKLLRKIYFRNILVGSVIYV